MAWADPSDFGAISHTVFPLLSLKVVIRFFSTVEGKTRVPPGWNYSDFEEAAKATVRDHDCFIPAKKGPTFVKIMDDSSGNNVVLKAQVHPGTSHIVHFYP